MNKVVIHSKLEQKIRTICSFESSVEWSGVLFYNIEKTNDSIIYNCIDLSLLDVGVGTGASVFTEFEYNPILASDIANNMELADCYQGLIHSHNHMRTTPSATDMNTIEELGKTMPVFLSVIVNNDGEYTALVSKREKLHIEGTKTVYNETENGEWIETISNKPIKKESIYVRYEQIEVEIQEDRFREDIYNRIESIKTSKRNQNIDNLFK